MKTKFIFMGALTGFALLLFLTLLKIYFKGKEELFIADELFKKKNLSQAIVHLERSIQWHIPGSEISELAAEKLWNITLSYETENKVDDALKSCRLLRGAFFSTRSIWTPGKKWINLCNEKIAYLMAVKSGPAEVDGVSFEKRKSKYRQKLQTDRPPSVSGSLLTEIGFFGWVTCAILFLLKAITPTTGLKSKPALIFSTAFFLFYGIWILGMFKA